MCYSISTVSTTDAAYKFKYFPRHGKWTKEMQLDLDEHSRRMAELMMYVQDQYKSKDQKKREQQREDTDADIGFSLQPSSSFPSRSISFFPQPIQGNFTPLAQYPPALQQGYIPIFPPPPGFPIQQRYLPKYR